MEVQQESVAHRTGALAMRVHEGMQYAAYHWHNEAEFLCVKSGDCTCRINGECVLMHAGEACLVRGGECHTVTADGFIYAIVFHPSILTAAGADPAMLTHIRFRRVFRAPDVIDRLHRIRCLNRDRPFAFELQMTAALLGIFARQLAQGAYEPTAPSAAIPPKFSDLLIALHAQYASHWTLRQMADRVYVSPSCLITWFKRYTGTTPIDYLNRYRAHRADTLLRTTDRPITDIALETGFDSPSYFIRVFRKYYHTAPRQVRHDGKSKKS